MTPTDLTPGTRVVVLSPRSLAGQTGTVIPMRLGLLNGHDCAVEFDNKAGRGVDPLCFYAHELAVEK